MKQDCPVSEMSGFEEVLIELPLMRCVSLKGLRKELNITFSRKRQLQKPIRSVWLSTKIANADGV
jgi:hypothetical protein